MLKSRCHFSCYLETCTNHKENLINHRFQIRRNKTKAWCTFNCNTWSKTEEREWERAWFVACNISYAINTLIGIVEATSTEEEVRNHRLSVSSPILISISLTPVSFFFVQDFWFQSVFIRLGFVCMAVVL